VSKTLIVKWEKLSEEEKADKNKSTQPSVCDHIWQFSRRRKNLLTINLLVKLQKSKVISHLWP
jgi:hypothetical protein